MVQRKGAPPADDGASNGSGTAPDPDVSHRFIALRYDAWHEVPPQVSVLGKTDPELERRESRW